MDKSLVERWVAALRSGKYTQGRSRLRNDDNSHCCLGVLVDVVNPSGWCGQNHELGNRPKPPHAKDGIPSTNLNLQATNDLGISGVVCDDLAMMNDEDKPFTEIATWIETHDLLTGDLL
jgi:hypothetical protein